MSLKRLGRTTLEPMLVSEHLSWGSSGGRVHERLTATCPTPRRHCSTCALRRDSEVQEALGRQILIENISSYVRFQCSEVPEWEFLTALTQQSGCAVLLDVNNIYVNAMNHRFDPDSYLHGIPRSVVKEFHLAGHTVARIQDREIRIDTHNTHVCDEVWGLYGAALKRFGPLPTLMEWDADIPSLETLQAEASKADKISETFRVVGW